MKARRACALALATVLGAAAVLHAYWAAGGPWGIVTATGGILQPDDVLSPATRLATIGLVGALVAGALLPMLRIGVIHTALSRRLVTAGCWAVAAVLFVIGVQDLLESAAFLRLFCGPLCLGLSVLAAAVVAPEGWFAAPGGGDGGSAGGGEGGGERAVAARARLSNRAILRLAWVGGGLLIACGLAHDAVVWTQTPALRSLAQDYQDGFAWLFLCTGTAIAFAGGLCLFAAHALVRREAWARQLTLVVCGFLLLLGVCGIALRQYGATIMFPLVCVSLCPWWLTRSAMQAGARPPTEVSR